MKKSDKEALTNASAGCAVWLVGVALSLGSLALLIYIGAKIFWAVKP